MRWKTGRRSSNVEDRRSQSGFPGFGRGGGRRRMPVRVGKKGIGGIGTIVLVLGALYFGIDPSIFMGTGGMAPTPMDPQLSPQTQSQSRSYRSGAEDERADFVSEHGRAAPSHGLAAGSRSHKKPRKVDLAHFCGLHALST